MSTVNDDERPSSIVQAQRSISHPSGGGAAVNAPRADVVHGRTSPANFSFHRANSAVLPGGEQALPVESCVRIFTTSAWRSYLLPWHVERQRDSTGTGFVVCATQRLIMTNAHVVTSHNFIEVSKHNSTAKHEAKVLVIAHDVDLALLTVDKDAFWESLLAVSLANSFPALYSEVRAVGFPAGGSTICITKGVVSRLDAHIYVHARHSGIVPSGTHNPGPVHIIQIDAAINPGNSGGPTFDSAGQVIGVASSGNPGAQNVGYIIPASVALNFLDEFHYTSSWGGLVELGLHYRELENKSIREYLGMTDTHTGVQVRSVSPLSPLADKVQKGDVLLSIDDQNISNEGTVPFTIAGQTVHLKFEAMVTAKRKGMDTKLTILRRGATGEGPIEFEVCVQLKPLPALMPRFDGVDCQPTYFICGGLVFSTVTTPLKTEYFEKDQQKSGVYVPKESWAAALYTWKEGDEEVVILLRGLKHSVNAGYDLHSVRVVSSVNSEQIRNLKELVSAVCGVRRRQDPFLCFSFSAADDEPAGSTQDPDVVLSTEACAAADRDILIVHRIPSLCSPNLQAHLEAEMSN